MRNLNPRKRLNAALRQIILPAVVLAVLFNAAPYALSAPAASKTERVGPRLSIDIPFVTIQRMTTEGPYLNIPWIANYISGVYRYAVSIAGLLAGIMFVLGGFYYLTAGGDTSRVQKGKQHITDALIGLLLVMGSYVMLLTINPDLVSVTSLKVKRVIRNEDFNLVGEIGLGEGEDSYTEGVHDTPETLAAAAAAADAGGTTETTPGAGTGTTAGGTAGGHGAPACAHYTEEIARDHVGCLAPGGPFPSPTRQEYACNYHTTGGRTALSEVKSLDVRGGYRGTYYAPVAGKIRYRFPSGWESCSGRGSISCLGGGTIIIEFGEGYRYGIAHALPLDGAPPDGSMVSAGQPIGSIGGKCCGTYAPGTPQGDTAKTKTTGWKKSNLSNSWSENSCRHGEPCEPPWLTGNSTGPHAHIKLTGPSGPIPILPCFKQN